MAPHSRNQPATPERTWRPCGRGCSGTRPGGGPNERRAGGCQRARNGLHPQAEARRNRLKVPFHPRMPTETAAIPRLAATAGAFERSAQDGLDDPAAFGALQWRCGIARPDGGRPYSMHPATGAQSLPEGDPGIPRWCRFLPCPKRRHCPGLGVTRDSRGWHRAPARAIRGGFAPVPRPASFSDES